MREKASPSSDEDESAARAVGGGKAPRWCSAAADELRTRSRVAEEEDDAACERESRPRPYGGWPAAGGTGGGSELVKARLTRWGTLRERWGGARGAVYGGGDSLGGLGRGVECAVAGAGPA